MSRYDELKEKGWKNLNAEERSEFQTLKPEADKPAQESKTITISKDELNALIKEEVAKATDPLKRQNEELKKESGGWKPVIEGKKKDPVARLRLYRDSTDKDFGIVVDYKHLRFDYDENTRKYDKDIYKVTLRYDGGKTEDIEMPLLAFASMDDFEQVTVVKETKQKLEKIHGEVAKSMVDKNGYTMAGAPGTNIYGMKTSVMVPLKEVTTKSVCVVKRANGEEFEIAGDRLNS